MSQNKKVLKITIPEPCHENVNKMTPVKGGRFCGSCEKTVIDFRGMTDRQIIRFYEKNKGNLCGVFLNEQLNRAIPFPTIVKPSTNWKTIAALASGLLLSGGLVAQSTFQTAGKPIPIVHTIVKGETLPKQSKDNIPTKVVKGVVMDNESGEALIGANIYIKGTDLGTITDLDGNFELTIPSEIKTFELAFSYTGYDKQIISFTENDAKFSELLKVRLEVGVYAAIAGDVVVVAGGIRSIEYIEEEHSIPEIAPIEFENKDIEIQENQLTVYPNPFEEKINITYFFEELDDYLFHLYDTKGSLVFAKSIQLSKGEQLIELDPPSQDLVNGLYILQVSDSQDRILASKKVFKGQP